MIIIQDKHYLESYLFKAYVSVKCKKPHI
uniref:Uncharacterized protein n=1 Tax=Arundo donax TaxID=35708 RepID=A0A0A9FL24_ARUDO